MIVTQTPYRISFFGGGTDYPSWFENHRGATLVSTIDKYCYLFCRHLPPFFHHKHRIVYSNIELIDEVEQIQHPAVKGVLRVTGADRGLEIHHHGDLPARAGMGSSSAFTVGLLNAVTRLKNEPLEKQQLAQMAIHIEQKVIGEVVGVQDQISTAYGGINRLDFAKDGNFTVTPLRLSKNRISELEENLMLFFTGFQRNASEIAKRQISNFSNKVNELKSLHDMVDHGERILIDERLPLNEFGELLHASWMLKREFAEGVSTPEIDAFYQAARTAGAIGGKLLGAGGGGFMLFFVPKNHQEKVRLSLPGCIHIPFKFEFRGSQLAMYDQAT